MGTPKSQGSRTTQKKTTSASDWKKKKNFGVELRVPSGNVCLVRPVGLEAFISQGLIPNALMPIIQESMKTGESPELTEDMVSAEMMAAMVKLFDSVTVYVVQQPTVHPAPKPGEEREEDLLYVDEVDLSDKMFIFNFAVGGTRSLEGFREELGERMELLLPVSGDEDSAERAAGDPG